MDGRGRWLDNVFIGGFGGRLNTSVYISMFSRRVPSYGLV